MVEMRESGGALYLDAKAEAVGRGDRKVGTEHLLLEGRQGKPERGNG